MEWISPFKYDLSAKTLFWEILRHANRNQDKGQDQNRDYVDVCELLWCKKFMPDLFAIQMLDCLVVPIKSTILILLSRFINERYFTFEVVYLDKMDLFWKVDCYSTFNFNCVCFQQKRGTYFQHRKWSTKMDDRHGIRAPVLLPWRTSTSSQQLSCERKKEIKREEQKTHQTVDLWLLRIVAFTFASKWIEMKKIFSP